jgi:hypothetical protein
MAEKSNDVSKETKVKKSRFLKNPKQTSDAQSYQLQDGTYVTVHKNGEHFSLDKEMDKSVDFLKKEYGFKEV